MRSRFKRFATVGLAALSLGAGLAAPAAAGGYYGAPGGYYGPSYDRGYYRPHYRSDYRRGHRGNGISNGQAVLLGVGALGLGLVLSDAFDKDKRASGRGYEDRSADRRVYDRGYDRYEGRDSLDLERRRLENERARLENERLRLENAERRRELGEDDYDGLADARLDGKDGGGGGSAAEDALDRDLAGASGRLNYGRAFDACLSSAQRDAADRGVSLLTPATWEEAQPLGQDAVRFRANLGRQGFDMVCDVSQNGVTRLDLVGV